MGFGMSSLSIGKAWDEAKAALQANRKVIVPVALGMVLLPAVISSMVEPKVAAGQQPPPGAWMLIVLAMIVVMIIGELALILLVNGWKGSVGEAIAKGARRVPVLILAALLFMIPLFILFSIILVIGGLAPRATQVDWASFSGLGWFLLLACTVALLFVSIRLLPLVAVVACETLGPIASLKRSFMLTSGHFWRLLGFLAMLAIGFLVVALTIGTVIGGMATILFGRPEPWSLSQLLIALAGGLVQAGFVMVYTAMLARIYAQLSAGQASVPEVKQEG